MAYFVDASPAAGIPGEVHDSKLNELGATRLASDGNTYIYLQGVASTASGDFVVFSPGVWTTVRMVTGLKGGSVAVASAAIVANKYGWYGLVGSFTATCESSIVSNAYCFAMATAGRVDDAVIKNEQVKNCRTTTAGVAGATATVTIARPFIGSYDESA